MQKGEDDEAIMYMKEIFPKLKEKYGNFLNEMWFIQRPGELVFVPGGWWHVVVNLDDTIAVTQNYCNSVNFEKVWVHVRSERKKMAVVFLRKLKKFFPEIYHKAVQMNEKDGFLMYDELKKVYEERKKKMSLEEREKYEARRSGSSDSSSSSEPSSSSSSSSSSSCSSDSE
jgi:histone arginine demethylase JMJD6